MGEKKSPAFQFYPTDWLADGNVSAMSLEEEGAYIRLLSYCWNEGGLPSDMKVLARFCRTTEEHFMEMWERIQKCFVFDGKKFQNPRLKKEREKQKSYSAKMSNNAKIRHQKEKSGDAAAVPKQCRNNAFQSPSPSSPSGEEPPKAPNPEQPGFEKFYELYPKKTTKRESRDYWRDNGLEKLLNTILEGLDAWKISDQWTKDSGTFIPDPIRFLKKARWEDNPAAASKQPKRLSATAVDARAIVPGEARTGGGIVF